MNRPIRYFLSCLGSAVVTVVVLTATLPLYTLPHMNDLAIGNVLVGALTSLPFALIIGVPVALPVAAIVGGLLLYLERSRGAPFSKLCWLAIGLVAGAFVSLFYGQAEPFWPTRAATALWFACGGAGGALAFICLLRVRTH